MKVIQMRLSSKSHKAVSGILSILLTTAIVFAIPAVPASGTSTSELKSKLSSLSSEKSELNAEIKELEEKKDSALEVKEKYDKEIAVIEEEISVYEDIISGLDADISEKEASIDNLSSQIDAMEVNIAVKQQEKDKLYEKFKTRIRILYEEDLTSYVGIVFLADDFADLISRIETVNSILQSDKDTMENLEQMAEDINADCETLTENKKQVEADKLAVEEKKDEQEENKSVLDNKKSELEDEQSASIKVLANLDASIANNETRLKQIASSEDSINKEIAAKQKDTTSKVTYTGSLLWPLPGHTNISSDFGYRYHPVYGYYSLHTGVDIPAPSGTKILCAGDGTVTSVKYDNAYGNMIIVSHGNGLSTMYAHMKSSANYDVGDTVKKGDVLGYVGTTGWSTGNHLHFSVLKNGNYVDPMGYYN